MFMPDKIPGVRGGQIPDAGNQIPDVGYHIPDVRQIPGSRSEDKLSEIEGEFKGNNRMLVYGGKIYVDMNM